MLSKENHIKRFWARVSKTDICWNWNGKKDKDGYGKFDGLKTGKAHRFSWQLHFGEIPKGFLVCHHCDNPSCVKPDHLFVGTHKDNTRDCWRKGRGVVNVPVFNPFNFGPAKLTPDQVFEIRRLHRDERVSRKDIAIRFNVCKNSIANIVTGVTWTTI